MILPEGIRETLGTQVDLSSSSGSEASSSSSSSSDDAESALSCYKSALAGNATNAVVFPYEHKTLTASIQESIRQRYDIKFSQGLPVKQSSQFRVFSYKFGSKYKNLGGCTYNGQWVNGKVRFVFCAVCTTY
jgi:hypothetical protein